MKRKPRLSTQQLATLLARFNSGESATQLATEYNVSRQYIYLAAKNPAYKSLEQHAVEVMDDKSRKSFVERLEVIKNRLLFKFETLLTSEDDIKKLTDLYAKISNDIRLINNQPTQIKETRTVKVDMAKILALPIEKRSLFLAGQLSTDEIQGEILDANDLSTEN